MVRSAVFDPTRRHRLCLGRIWDESLRSVTFVMLNPNEADEHRDDPTLRRCVALARSSGFGALTVVNLFSYRTPAPGAIKLRLADAVHPDNDRHLLQACESADAIIAAWGNQGSIGGRALAVNKLLQCRSIQCFGLTKLGQPRHPLYLSREAKPISWRESE